MSKHSLIQAAAAILSERRRRHAAGPRLPQSCRPADFDTAFAVQDAVAALLGTEAGGWKCGTPAPGKLIAATVHAGDICRAAPCPVTGERVRIEPEIAFVLGRDLPARAAPWTPAEVDAAVGTAHLALELIGSRYQQPEEIPFPEHLADSLLNQGLFIGPQVDLAAVRSAGALAIRVDAGGEAMQFDGRHPDGNPLLPLYWLAEFLRVRGRGLRAGQAVITGSYAGSFEVPADQDLGVHFDRLGLLAVRFARQ